MDAVKMPRLTRPYCQKSATSAL